MSAGAFDMGSRPSTVFGKAITSRILFALQRMAIRRSRPRKINRNHNAGGGITEMLNYSSDEKC